MINKMFKEFDEDFEKQICEEHPLNDQTCIECSLARQYNSLISLFKSFLRKALEEQASKKDITWLKEIAKLQDIYWEKEKRLRLGEELPKKFNGVDLCAVREDFGWWVGYDCKDLEQEISATGKTLEKAFAKLNDYWFKSGKATRTINRSI